MSELFHNIAYLFLFSILAVAMITDLRTRKIPNRLTYPAMILAVVYHTATSGATGLVFSLAGLALGTGIFLIPYLMGGMGAGDAKLVGAVGSIIGPAGVCISILYTCLAGGVYALGYIVFRKIRSHGFSSFQPAWLKEKILPQSIAPTVLAGDSPKLCYGVAIALGTFIYMALELFHSGQMINFQM